MGFSGVQEASKLSCNGSKLHLCMMMKAGCQLVKLKQLSLLKALMMLPWQPLTTSTGICCETYIHRYIWRQARISYTRKQSAKDLYCSNAGNVWSQRPPCSLVLDYSLLVYVHVIKSCLTLKQSNWAEHTEKMLSQVIHFLSPRVFVSNSLTVQVIALPELNKI